MSFFGRASGKKKRQTQFMEGQDGYAFRRSRTLTGTTSVKVQPAAQKRGQLKTARLKLHQLRAHQSQLLRVLLGILAGTGIILYMAATFIGRPQVVFAQSGNQPTKDYIPTVQEYLSGRPFERLGILLRGDDLQSYMKKRHSEIQTIAVDRNWFGGGTELVIYFRQPLLVWRLDTKTFFVDDSGTAFEYNHFAQPDVVVTDESGISPNASSGAVASSRFITFLGQMVGAVNENQQGRVVHITIPTSTRQIDLKLEGRDYIIKTHIDRDPLEQAQDIAHALKYFDEKGIKPEYVDVRVAHKAFYKG